MLRPAFPREVRVDVVDGHARSSLEGVAQVSTRRAGSRSASLRRRSSRRRFGGVLHDERREAQSSSRLALLGDIPGDAAQRDDRALLVPAYPAPLRQIGHSAVADDTRNSTSYGLVALDRPCRPPHRRRPGRPDGCRRRTPTRVPRRRPAAGRSAPPSSRPRRCGPRRSPTPRRPHRRHAARSPAARGSPRAPASAARRSLMSRKEMIAPVTAPSSSSGRAMYSTGKQCRPSSTAPRRRRDTPGPPCKRGAAGTPRPGRPTAVLACVVDRLVHADAAQLLRRPAEHLLRGGVHERHVPSRSTPKMPSPTASSRCRLRFLGLGELALGTLARRHVPQHSLHAPHVAGGIP